MSAASYLAGTLVFTLTVVPILVAAWLLVRRRLTHLTGAEAALAFGLLATAGFLAAVVIPGALGVLSRATVPLTALALAAITSRATNSYRRVRGETPYGGATSTARARPGVFAWLLGVGAVVVAAVYVVAFVIDRRSATITGVDVLNFGLPMVARWIQQGQIWSVGHYSVYWSFGSYPNNGEAVQTLALLPWHSDAFVRFSLLPYLTLSGLATYALSGRLGAPKPAALAWGAAVVAIPESLLSALDDTKPDLFMLACFLGGLVFLVRHAQLGDRSDLILGGLGLGLAFGSRWYGLTAVVATVVVWVVARLLVRVRWRALAGNALQVAALIAAAGGFWLLRNLIEVGNPLFPVKVAVLGNVVFDAPPDYIRQRAGFSLLQYATDVDVWRTYLWPALRNGFALTGGVALVACVVALGLVVARRRRATAPEVLVAVIAALGLLLTAIYAATPYTAQGGEGFPVLALVNTRYGLPAVASGAAVAAALGGRSRRWALAMTALGLLSVLDGVAHVDNAGGASYLAQIARPSRMVEALITLAVIAAALLVLQRSRRAIQLTLLTAAAALAVAVGYVHQTHYIDQRYLGRDPALDAVLEDPGTHTVALTGSTDPGVTPVALPLNGPRLENRVRVLGRPLRHVLFPLRNRGDLAAALRGEPYDVLFVQRLADGRPSATARWAEELGWRPAVTGKNSILFRR